MTTHQLHTAITIFMCIVLSACTTQDESKNTIEAEVFEEVYAQLLDSSAVPQQTTDTTLSPVARRILERNGVSLEQFNATVNYYNADTKKWGEFYTNIVQRFDEKHRKKEKRDSTSS